jgi:hypothetical protein
MRNSGIIALLGAVFAVGPAYAQVQQVTPNYKVVEHGRSIKVDSFGTYNPDCSVIGRATVSVTAPPQGGTVETSDGRAFPTFLSGNIRFQCDKRNLPATLLYYRAAPSFTGTDTFTIEVVFGSGEARQLRYTVNVR